ncbi:hypothetical protein Nepgr_007388 [Nepenthes gracilis]|uniref:Uncharacterized protein n=1 Tax=Nepenthes gracilis TaxID=150966 RepID=A0AAD3XI93_NEPGR|nr:hypothetical protein Nepgr_007388 [Nepenthes gracilis]
MSNESSLSSKSADSVSLIGLISELYGHQQAIDEPQELPSSSTAAGDADLKHEEPEIKLMLKMNPFLGQQAIYVPNPSAARDAAAANLLLQLLPCVAALCPLLSSLKAVRLFVSCWRLHLKMQNNLRMELMWKLQLFVVKLRTQNKRLKQLLHSSMEVLACTILGLGFLVCCQIKGTTSSGFSRCQSLTYQSPFCSWRKDYSWIFCEDFWNN